MSSYLDKTGLTYLWSKIKAKIPTKTSDLNNDSGFLTSPDLPYLTCATAAGTAAKTTTLVKGSFTADDLVAGAQVLVKFTYANTIANPTISINGTTAKSIKRYGTTAPSTSAASSWNANEVVLLVYDGTYWMLEGWMNTTYSTMSEAEMTAGTSTTARLITPARLKEAIETWESPNPTKTSDLTNDSGFITVDDIPEGTTYKIGDIIKTLGTEPPSDGEWSLLDGKVIDQSVYPELYALYPYNSSVTTDNTFTVSFPSRIASSTSYSKVQSIQSVNGYIVAFVGQHMCYRKENETTWTIRDISSIIPTISTGYPQYISRAYMYYDVDHSVYLLTIKDVVSNGYNDKTRYGLYRMPSLDGTITTIITKTYTESPRGNTVYPIYKVGEYYCATFNYVPSNNSTYPNTNIMYVTKNPLGTWTNIENTNLSNVFVSKPSYIYYYDNKYILGGTYYNSTSGYAYPAIAFGEKNVDLLSSSYTMKVLDSTGVQYKGTYTGYMPYVVDIIYLEDKNLYAIFIAHKADVSTYYPPIFTLNFQDFYVKSTLPTSRNGVGVYISPYLYVDYTNNGLWVYKIYDSNHIKSFTINNSSMSIFNSTNNDWLITSNYAIRISRDSKTSSPITFTETTYFKTLQDEMSANERYDTSSSSTNMENDVYYTKYYVKVKD